MREQQSPLEPLLQQAVPEAFRRRIAALPAEEVLQKQYDFSSLDRRIRAALKRLRKERRVQAAPRGASLRTAKRIALVAALLAALLVGMLTVSAELRVYVKDTIAKWTGQNVDIQYEVGGYGPDALPEEYGPHYIPDGFVYSEGNSVIGSSREVLYYESADGSFIQILMRVAENASMVSMDTEHTDFRTIEYGDGDAYLGTFEDGEGYTMLWIANGIEHELYISAYLPESEVFQIADNIY